MDRWLLFSAASVVLLLFANYYTHLILSSPNHRVIGSFAISGEAANHHLNPFAIYPSVWQIRPYAHATGPVIYDRNLQPACLLPLFQLLALAPIASAVAVWTFTSALIFIAGTGVLLSMFRESVRVPLILLLLLSEPILSVLRVGQDFALMFAIAVVVVCLLRFGKLRLASICIGLLVAIHPNFGLWPILLFVAGQRRMALTSAAVALGITALPMLVYGPSIYIEWLHAIASDNHSYLLTDISLTGFFTRAGHRYTGMALSAALACWLLFTAHKRRYDAVTLGGIAVCAAILCSPLGWYDYIVAAFPLLAPNRLKRISALATALMFIWDKSWLFSGQGFWGRCGSVQFLIAICLFLISFLRNRETGVVRDQAASEAPVPHYAS